MKRLIRTKAQIDWIIAVASWHSSGSNRNSTSVFDTTYRPMATLGLLMLGASVCFGQFETSEVLGTVRDASEKPVTQAAVTLINQGTGAEAKAITDGTGDYDFFNVKVGRYTITIEQPGFSKFSSPDIAVNVNARQRV